MLLWGAGMQITVKNWGNSESLPTPVGILAAVRLRLDDVVDLSAQDGCIVIVPIRTPAPNNAAPLAAITPEN